jgi:hypothetical protein
MIAFIELLKKITVLNIAKWVNKAWFETLKISTIIQGFEHAGFNKYFISATGSAEIETYIAQTLG